MKKQSLISVVILIIALVASSCDLRKNNQSSYDLRKSKVKTDIKADEKGYADVNGIKLYYEVYGSGKPILLLHGSFLNISMNWSHIIPLLMAQERQVIVAEMQGHGHTKDIPRELSYEAMADDVSELLMYLKIDSADILGYSMGGGVAFQLAVRHPQQVRKLIVLSGTYAHDGWLPEVESSFATINAAMFKDSQIERQYNSLDNDPAHFPRFIKKVISIDLVPYDWTQQVKKLRMPLLMIIGDADGVRYEHALELFRAKGGGKMGDFYGLSSSRLAILPATTHVGIVKKPDHWIPMVNDFLDPDFDNKTSSF